jgi:hypothetical protein
MSYVILTLAVALVTAVLIIALSASKARIDERLAETGDILSGGTLLLALIAALVALQAFAITTGLPDLQVQVKFGSSDRNRPVFLASTLQNGWVQASDPQSQTTANIRLRNQSNYAAQNVAMIVHLHGMAFGAGDGRDRSKDGWWETDSVDGDGVTALQWDGDGDFVIHGVSVRRLPDLNLEDLRCIDEPTEASIEIEVLAFPDYRRKIVIPVTFFIDGMPRTRYPVSDSSCDWV